MNKKLKTTKQKNKKSLQSAFERNHTVFSSLFFLSVLIIIYILNEMRLNTLELAQKKQENLVADLSEVSSTQNSGVPDFSVLPWNLILVNREHLLTQDLEITLADISSGNQVDERIAPFLLQMVADAKNEGIVLEVCSGYRSVALQTKLYEENLQYYQSLGYDETQSHDLTELYVQPPGASEHHTGLAVDFLTDSYRSLDENFSHTAAYGWLTQHAQAYGFIERYPQQKEASTGIAWEPWHYRYVGADIAQEIVISNLSLEEYLNQLYQ